MPLKTLIVYVTKFRNDEKMDKNSGSRHFLALEQIKLIYSSNAIGQREKIFYFCLGKTSKYNNVKIKISKHCDKTRKE